MFIKKWRVYKCWNVFFFNLSFLNSKPGRPNICKLNNTIFSIDIFPFLLVYPTENFTNPTIRFNAKFIYSNRNDIIYFAILLHSWSGQLYNFNMYGSSITTYKITFLYIFNSCIKAQHTNRVTMIYPYDMNLNGLKQGVSFELSKCYLVK